MKGLIFSIKKYSVHDGPGIRLTFFMKGCPLNCRWCHNPEGILPGKGTVSGIFRIGEKEFSREEQVGKYYSVREVIDILEREKVFFEQSGGGVTFSGGEPMMQPDFLSEALEACKQAGFHTAVDTSGFSTLENFREVSRFTDIFLFDIKHLDNVKHIEGTGVSNNSILSNYEFLLENAREINARIPVIPGFNDDRDHMDNMIDFIKKTRTDVLTRINLLPFHRIGSSKYRKFNIPYMMDGVEPPEDIAMSVLKERFMETGLKVKIGG